MHDVREALEIVILLVLGAEVETCFCHLTAVHGVN